MASVPPPDVWYKLSLPSEVAEKSLLSALQLEAVIYACQQHEKLLPNGKRAGFLIGKCQTWKEDKSNPQMCENALE